MRYPSFLKKQATIGTVAPSFGVSGYPYEDRYLNSKKKFTNLGYTIKESEHLYGIEKGKSASAEIRAKDFMDMYLSLDTDFLVSVAGGELMLEILPYIDFETLKYAKPKYFMGYSDNTTLVFTLPIFADVAAIYGSNFGSFGMSNWHCSLQDSYDLMLGRKLKFNSYDKYEVEDLSHLEGNSLCGYNLTEEVKYCSLDNQSHKFSGRMIGGCLDVLSQICGTKFDKVDEFIERYREDGFIWFLESCDLNVFAQRRALFQLINAGWFKNCKGILYGRPLNSEPIFDYTVEDALMDSFKELNIPVIYGCDFGHVPPSMPIIAGSVATVEYEDGKASIEYQLR